MGEKHEAKRSGHRLQKNSGRGQFSKGDAQSEMFVIDYKEANKSFTLSRDIWAKICTDAFRVDRAKYPKLRIIIGEGEDKIRLDIIASDVADELEEVYVDKVE